MGNGDLKEIDAGNMDPEGRQLTQIGKILGIVAVALMAVGLVVGILVMAMGAGAAAIAPAQ